MRMMLLAGAPVRMYVPGATLIVEILSTYQSSLELIPFPANIESLLFLFWNPHEITETNKNPTFLDQT